MTGLTVKLNPLTLKYEVVQPPKAEVIKIDTLKERRTNKNKRRTK